MIDSSDPTTTTMTTTPPAEQEPAKRSRLPLVIGAVAVVSLLVGSGAAVSAMYLLGWRPVPSQDYAVLVHLKTDATAEQKAVVESALARLPNAGAVDFTDRKEAWAEMQKMWKDQPDFLDRVSPEAAPESFDVEIDTDAFTCDGITPIRDFPGVDQVQVAQLAVGSKPPAKIFC